MTTAYEPRLLVVDDDPLIREELESLFAAQPYQVECVASVTDAMQRLAEREFALALVDVRIGGGDGIALTKDIREHWPDVDVIMITGYGSIKNAVEAMRQGAVDYITKPFQPEELLHATQKALERRRLIDEIEYLRAQLSDRYSFANMVSRNPAMLEIFATLEMLARNDVTVLITGESGTGKELAARAIHFQGKRRAGRFVAINCAAVPEALLESELFGYERGAFTGAMTRARRQDRARQRRHALPRRGGEHSAADAGEAAARARGARHRAARRQPPRAGRHARRRGDQPGPRQAVREGQVREDFYYRINVVPISLPPLRERREDIPLLVAEFLRNNPLAREKGINRLTERAVNQLMAYDWPGNIRELSQRHGARGAARQGRHDQGGRRADQRHASTAGAARRRTTTCRCASSCKGAEREYLAQLLNQYQGGIARCARHASVDQATLHRKIKAHGLRAGDSGRTGRVH